MKNNKKKLISCCIFIVILLSIILSGCSFTNDDNLIRIKNKGYRISSRMDVFFPKINGNCKVYDAYNESKSLYFYILVFDKKNSCIDMYNKILVSDYLDKDEDIYIDAEDKTIYIGDKKAVADAKL